MVCDSTTPRSEITKFITTSDANYSNDNSPYTSGGAATGNLVFPNKKFKLFLSDGGKLNSDIRKRRRNVSSNTQRL